MQLFGKAHLPYTVQITVGLNSWSFGIGWNLHNEAILKGVGWIKQLKLRASIGLTGNQNFDTNAAIATYNYYTGVVYGGLAGKFTGAYLASMPNSKLKWEQKRIII